MKRNFLMVLMFVFMLSSILSACSSNQANEVEPSGAANSPDSETAGADTNWDTFTPYKDKVTMTIGRQGVSGNNLPKGDTLENNQFLKYVEDKLNVKINYEFSVDDGEAYKQKVNLAITSTNVPDVMIVDETQFKKLAEAGMLADLKEAYDKSASPLIKEYYDSFKGRVLDSVTIDGKLLALPDTNLAGNHQLLWVRKDWLDKVGMQPPSTMDEVTAVSKAFVDQKTGGDGTIGLTGDPIMYTDGAFFTFDPIFAAYGSFPQQWVKDASGNITNGSIMPETKKALEKLREMYADGLIDKEFVTRKWNDNAALVASGKAGMVFAPWFAGWMLSDSVKNDKNAEWIPLSAPLGENGKRNLLLSKPSGQYLVVHKGFEHPEAMVKALSVQYEGLRLKDESAKSLYEGLGVSWLNWPFNLQLNYEDAVYRDAEALSDALAKHDSSNLSPDQMPKYDSLIIDEKAPKQDIANYANKLAFFTGAHEVGTDKLQKIESVFYGQTPSMFTKGTNLTKMESEMFLKIITGVESVDSFDKFVKSWKQLGGDDITKEVTAEVGN
ncbi:extracellular solute-binding protein [Bacillus sp. FJAT-28004]|uniref:extracellular solute-binding protein n=1 Tax=Bacillus sp. FJAT-28004 TaxID=1679165 RepID=UPI0006B47CCF|nr:extracellular solute-binding protein [Bacillus sp. FJAT-28004]